MAPWIENYRVALIARLIGETMFLCSIPERNIVELTLRTALCGFFNRFNDTLQISMEAGVIKDMLSRGSRIDDLPHSESLETQDGTADRAAVPH